MRDSLFLPTHRAVLGMSDDQQLDLEQHVEYVRPSMRPRFHFAANLATMSCGPKSLGRRKYGYVELKAAMAWK